jgi:hypothetical protein
MSSPHETTFVEEIRKFESSSPESFDRVGFALSALSALRSERVTVAVYARRAGADFFVQSVRDLRGGHGARWALVGIPAGASRAQIARELAELLGVSEVPYALDVLLHADQSTD